MNCLLGSAYEGQVSVLTLLDLSDPFTRSNQKRFGFVIVQLQPITSYPSPDSQHTAQRQQSVNQSQMELKTGEAEYRQQICDDRNYVEK